MRGKVVVASGWWSDTSRSAWNIGDDLTRSPQFFALWHRQVMLSFSPDSIVVTDSNSPLKPEWSKFQGVVPIALDKNYGHANDIRVGRINTKYCGFTRSVLMGAMYALCCDADYFIYVEQDCLVHGENLLDVAVGRCAFDFYCGQRTKGGRGFNGAMASAMFQQSLQIATKKGIERLIVSITSAEESDGVVSPEVKMVRDMRPHGLLKIPYGRSRPVDFSRSHYYAQHLNRDELTAFMEAQGLLFSDWF
jgi:hypothetical protein